MDISEKDWKLFRERVSDWQENYMKGIKIRRRKMKQNMMIHRLETVIMAFAIIVSFVNGLNVQAAGSSGSISLSKASISVKEGMTGKITVKNKPAGAKVLWSSKNKKIAKVKKGIITGLERGKTVVTCKVAYWQGQKKKTKELKAAVTVKNNKQVYPKHKPYGKGVGAKPGRVVWSHNPKSVQWNGKGYWWQTGHFDEKVITKMFQNSIASLGGAKKAKTGWEKLFQAQNKRRGKENKKYTKGEKIAIKANINGSGVFDDDDSGKTNMSYTNPVLLKVLLTSLVKDAGVAPSDITVYDVSRIFPTYMVEMCTKGELKGVHFVGRNNGAADKKKPIHWSYSFRGAVNYLPTCVTNAEYVINFANLKGHSYGITLCGKNHFGSFINGNEMRPPEGANLHQFLTMDAMGVYSPLVDLMANYELGNKTVLYMLDALISAPSEGDDITGSNARWEQSPFNGYYTSSIFVSQDPVAIDSVGADFLMNEPAVTNHNDSLNNNATVENYLHEAALAKKAPSGNVYKNGDGKKVSNLGVHEHWNNPVSKKYSRNLGKKEGIELVKV